MLERPISPGATAVQPGYSGARPAPLRRLLRGRAAPDGEAPAPKWMTDGIAGPLEVIVGLVRRHWILLIAATLLAMAVAFAVSSARQPVYRARGSLEVLERNQEFLNSKQILPFSETGPSSVPADVQTHVKKLQSDNMLGRAIDRAGPPPESTEDRLGLVRRRLDIRTDNHTRIIELFYEAPDPAEAAAFLNALTTEFTEESAESRSAVSQRTRIRLMEQLAAQRRRLEAAENALQQYAARANLILTAGNDSAATQKLRGLQDDLSKAKSDRLSKQTRYEMAVGPRGAFLADVVNDQSMVAAQSHLAELKRQRAEMSVQFNSEYPKLKKLEAQIAAVNESIESTRARIVHRIENEYREAAYREELLGRDIVEAIRSVQQDAQRLVQYEILNRDVESNRQLYMAMLQRVNEAGIATAMQEGNVRILDTASVPRDPVKPNRRADVALGGVIGLLLGCLLAVWRERPDHMPRQPGDLESALAIPELGAVPLISAAEYRLNCLAGSSPLLPRLTSADSSRPSLRPSLIGTSPQESTGSLHLLVWQSPHSRAAEAFRSALTSVLFSGSGGEPPRTLTITSCLPGEGKSTVACNLACAAAEMRQRVLLIDGNVSEPCLHRWFGVSNDFGWFNIPAHEFPAKSVRQVAKRTLVEGLYVLPAGESRGARPTRPPSEQILALLSSAAGEFDVVLIDTPALLDHADARLAGRLSDGVILVVRAGDTVLDAVCAARRCFARDGTPFLGAILNGWDTKTLRRMPGHYFSQTGLRRQYRLEAASKF